MTTKATLYLDPKVYRALKVKAALSDKTVSETANTLIEQGLASPANRSGAASKVELRSEGKMGFPVLTLGDWPEDYVFDRASLYD